MKRNGFTLIELLAVIATVAILIAITLPVLHISRQQARAAVCGSNLKQLTLTLIMYEHGNGTFPYAFVDSEVEPPGGYVGKVSHGDDRGWWWFHFLAGSLGENFDKGTIFWCPSRNVKDPGVKTNILCGNYGVNRSICKHPEDIGEIEEFTGIPLGLNQIRRPAKTLLIIDSGYSLISWRAATDELNALDQPFENIKREEAFYIPGLWINEQRTFSPACERDAIDGRHPNKTVNVGFVDGHIDHVKADDLFVEEAGGNYSNRSPLWLPSK